MQSIETTRTRKGAELPLLDRVVLALLFFFLLSDVLGGVIRYYGAQFHLTFLSYVPHLVLALAIVPMFFAYLLSEGVTPTYLTIFVLFGVGAVYGTLNLNSPSQMLFGLWVLVVFLYGIVALPAIIHGWRRLTPYAFCLWAIAVAGVLINFFHVWPWIGLEYQVGATSLEASRLWQTGGYNFARLPGFSRVSVAAALQILILCVFLSGTLRRKWWIPVWVLSGIAIALTTHKTAMVIFIFFSITRVFRRSPTRPFWRRVPVVLACLDMLLPFSLLLINLDWSPSGGSLLWRTLITSLIERVKEGWPVWLHMIVERGNVLFGRGIGGIGAAQRYFEPALYSPADNVAVYLYGTFGILGLIFLYFYGRNAARIRTDGQVGRFFFLCACLVLLEGVTVSVIDGTFIALAFGASFRYLEEYKVAIPQLVRKWRGPTPLRQSGSQPTCT